MLVDPFPGDAPKYLFGCKYHEAGRFIHGEPHPILRQYECALPFQAPLTAPPNALGRMLLCLRFAMFEGRLNLVILPPSPQPSSTKTASTTPFTLTQAEPTEHVGLGVKASFPQGRGRGRYRDGHHP